MRYEASPFSVSRPLGLTTQRQAPISFLQDSLDLRGFLVIYNWRMAAIEGWGELICTSAQRPCLQQSSNVSPTFLLGAISSGLSTVRANPLALTAYAALVNAIGLGLIISAVAPACGAHLNPSITMSIFFAGLSAFPRSAIHIVAQCIGAISAGYWLRLGLGDDYLPVVSMLSNRCFRRRPG